MRVDSKAIAPKSLVGRIADLPSPRPMEVTLPGVGLLTIVMPTVGGSIRTGGGMSVTRRCHYASIRSGCTIFGEGATEILAAQIHEVVTSTVRIKSQPLRAELRTSDGIERYIPDQARLREDGRWRIAECKRDWDGFDSAGAQRQQRLGRIVADALGAEYVRETMDSLGTPTFLAAVETVQLYRTVMPRLTHRHVAADMLDREGVVPLGRLADALHPARVVGVALACAMMVRRLVSIDLDRPIGPDSPVRAVPPLPPVIPDLFDALRHRRPAV